MKVYIVIAETMDTNGEFYSEVYLENTAQRAGEFASSLIADMAETMGVKDIDPTETWEIGNDYWFYRVRTDVQEFEPSDISLAR